MSDEKREKESAQFAQAVRNLRENLPALMEIEERAMLDGNTEDRPTVNENYTSALSTGNTRLEAHRTTRADLIAAAGMNQHRTGCELMRLSSEWNSGAVPKPVDAPDVKLLAREIAQHRFELWRQQQKPMMRVQVDDLRAKNAIHKSDIEQAYREAALLQARSVDWNLEENKLRFQRLKSLVTVRAALAFYVHEKGWSDGEHLVASVLRYFLSPNCPSCNGSGLHMVPGTLGRMAKSRCKECRDNAVRGKRNIPHGARGKRLLEYMTACTGAAAHEMREGTYRLHRRNESEESRQERRAEREVQKQRRVDAELARDAECDAALIAQQFKDGMECRKN